MVSMVERPLRWENRPTTIWDRKESEVGRPASDMNMIGCRNPTPKASILKMATARSNEA
jgi:hypothetical protein